jgi:hypothetical protein
MYIYNLHIHCGFPIHFHRKSSNIDLSWSVDPFLQYLSLHCMHGRYPMQPLTNIHVFSTNCKLVSALSIWPWPCQYSYISQFSQSQQMTPTAFTLSSVLRWYILLIFIINDIVSQWILLLNLVWSMIPTRMAKAQKTPYQVGFDIHVIIILFVCMHT